MKTRLHNSKLMFASFLTVIAFTFLSLQAKAQTCQAGFTFAVNTNTVTFTNTSTGGVLPVYSWSFGDGNYDWSTNPVHAFTNVGTYNVCLTMYDSLNGNCQSTYCASVVITNAPTPPCNANFVFYADSSNQNQNQFYDLSSNNPTSWSWTFGDGSTSALQNPVHQYATAGNYVACLTITDAFGQTCTHCDTVSYYPCTLNAGFTSNTSNDPQISFTNTSTGGFAPYYYWSFGDGSNTWGSNATHTYQNSGTYNVCITAYDSINGCSDTYCSTIAIVNAPSQPCVAQFYSYPDTNNTFPGTVHFYDYSTAGSPILSWSWTFGDGNTSSAMNPTHHYAQAGTYQVCLTITTSTGTCSSCSTITVNTNPVPCSASMYLVPDSLNPSSLTWYAYTYITGVAPFTYLWSFGDGTTSTQQYPTHTYAQAGNYLICLTITDANNCTSSTCDSTYKLMLSGSMLQLVVMNTTGIEENAVSVNSIFPNPANDVIDISLSQLVKGHLMITDMIGRAVYTEKINSNNVKVNVSALPIGYYNLSIVSGTKMTHAKIMIAR